MREGTFFRIPEGPDDVEALRREARPIDTSNCPEWLDVGDAGSYLCLDEDNNRRATGTEPRLPPDETASNEALRQIFEEEASALEARGLMVSRPAEDRIECLLYVPSQPAYPEWSIGIYSGPSLTRLRPAPETDNPVLTRYDVTDHVSAMVADPFILPSPEGWQMFFETLNWLENRGEIGVATSRNGYRWTYQGVVLAEPFHLSYPHAFEVDGSYYMVPESKQDTTVRLYRAYEYPNDWRLESVLLEDVALVDATPFRFDGSWWLFAGADGEGRNDELHLYFSDRLEQNWVEHPRSPVIRGDAHHARPAGRMAVEREKLIRFAQNCDPEYGLDIHAFEIVELTRGEFVERSLPVAPILARGSAAWNNCGVHHIDSLLGRGRDLRMCVDGRGSSPPEHYR